MAYTKRQDWWVLLSAAEAMAAMWAAFFVGMAAATRTRWVFVFLAAGTTFAFVSWRARKRLTVKDDPSEWAGLKFNERRR